MLCIVRSKYSSSQASTLLSNISNFAFLTCIYFLKNLSSLKKNMIDVAEDTEKGMEVRPASTLQRSDMKHLSNLGVSSVKSSSLPVLPVPVEELYPSLPDSQQVSLERELRADVMAPHTSPVSNSYVVGNLFSSASGFSSDLHFSSSSTQGRHLRNGPFISQSSNREISFPVTHSSHSGLFQSATSSGYTQENEDWCTDALQGFLDFSDDVSIPNSAVHTSHGVSFEDHTKQSDWHEWTDQLITNGDTLDANWNDLNANVTEPELEVSFFDPKSMKMLM